MLVKIVDILEKHQKANRTLITDATKEVRDIQGDSLRVHYKNFRNKANEIHKDLFIPQQ